MTDSKKYYYLKLKDNFFDSDEMIVLESMPNGYLYSNILLKLYLRSLKNEGKLMFSNRIPFNSKMLAQITRHTVDSVKKAIEIFVELELIEVMDDGAIYMLEIQTFIGESSTEADRKRLYRQKIDSEKQLNKVNGQVSDKCPDKSPPELEKEKEIKREKHIVGLKPDNASLSPHHEIVTYLNAQVGSRFKATSKATQTKIKARLGEGFTVADFKKVIDIKTSEWLNDPNMQKYLRPETLFGTKFEGYLNQQSGKKTADSFIRDASEYDFF